MSTQHGGGEGSATSPADPAVAEPDAGVSATAEPAADDTPAADTPAPAADAPTTDDAAGAGSDPDEGIHAAGGTVVGETEVAGLADRSRIRRAPRYKRFAVLGALMGVLIAAVATLVADYTPEPGDPSGVSAWGLFLLLVTILVPFLILVSCAVAMFTDRAARLPPRNMRKKKARR